MANTGSNTEGVPPAHERIALTSRIAGQVFIQAGIAVFLLGTGAMILLMFEPNALVSGSQDGRELSDYAWLVAQIWPGVVLASGVLAGIGIGCRLYGEAQMARLERHDELMLALEGGEGAAVAGADEND